MDLKTQVKKIRQIAGTVRGGFYRLEATKNIAYKREALNIQELQEELERLEAELQKQE